MTRYGVNVYRGVDESAPPTLYGPDIAYDYAADFSATPIDYGKILLRWSTPKGSWSSFKILRNTYGYPVDSDDGTIIFENYTGADSPYTDTDISEGQEYYYSIFVYGIDNVWHRSASAIGLSVKNFNTAELLWNYLPLAVKTLTRNVLDTNPENEDLKDFLALVAFEYDLEKTLVYRIGDSTKAPRTPRLLLPALLAELNLEYEPLIGDARLRTLANKAVSLYQAKGSKDGVIEYVKAFSSYDNTIRVGKNLFLDYNQSSFDESLGGWVINRAEVTGYGGGTYGGGGYGGYAYPIIGYDPGFYVETGKRFADGAQLGSFNVTPVDNKDFTLAPGMNEDITKRGIPVRSSIPMIIKTLYTATDPAYGLVYRSLVEFNTSKYPVELNEIFYVYAGYGDFDHYAKVIVINEDSVVIQYYENDSESSAVPVLDPEDPEPAGSLEPLYFFSVYTTAPSEAFFQYSTLSSSFEGYIVLSTIQSDIYGNINYTYSYPTNYSYPCSGGTSPWSRRYSIFSPGPDIRFVYPAIMYDNAFNPVLFDSYNFDCAQVERITIDHLESLPYPNPFLWVIDDAVKPFEEARTVFIQMKPNRSNLILNPNFTDNDDYWTVSSDGSTPPTSEIVNVSNPGNVHTGLNGNALEIYNNSTGSPVTCSITSDPLNIPINTSISENYTFSGYLTIGIYADPGTDPVSVITPEIISVQPLGDSGTVSLEPVYIVTELSSVLKDVSYSWFSAINNKIKIMAIEIDTLKFKFYEGIGSAFKYNEVPYASSNLHYSYATASAWTANTVPLKPRLIGVETDTFKFKIGNGADVWADLPYTTSLPAWIRFSMTVNTADLAAPTTDLKVRLNWIDLSENQGNALLIDQIMVEKAAVAGSYFDGYTGQEDTSSIGWAGTPQNSVSHYYKNKYIINDRLKETIVNYVTAGTTVDFEYLI